jgi:hypothetical protein
MMMKFNVLFDLFCLTYFVRLILFDLFCSTSCIQSVGSTFADKISYKAIVKQTTRVHIAIG